MPLIHVGPGQTLESFRIEFADEMVRQYARRAQQTITNGDVLDIEGGSVRKYAVEVADAYFNDPDCWCEGVIDPEYCAEVDFSYWEWEE